MSSKYQDKKNSKEEETLDNSSSIEFKVPLPPKKQIKKLGGYALQAPTSRKQITTEQAQPAKDKKRKDKMHSKFLKKRNHPHASVQDRDNFDALGSHQERQRSTDSQKYDQDSNQFKDQS